MLPSILITSSAQESRQVDRRRKPIDLEQQEVIPGSRRTTVGEIL